MDALVFPLQFGIYITLSTCQMVYIYIYLTTDDINKL